MPTGLENTVQATSVVGICNDNVSPRRRGVRDAKPNKDRPIGVAANRQSERSERQQFSTSDTALRVSRFAGIRELACLRRREVQGTIALTFRLHCWKSEIEIKSSRYPL